MYRAGQRVFEQGNGPSWGRHLARAATTVTVACWLGAVADGGAVFAQTAAPVAQKEKRSSGTRARVDWLDLQVRLDRLGLSPGEIDGAPGRNSREALRAFQQRQGITPTGRPDAATVVALEKASPEPVLVSYTLTAADLQGPFTPEIPGDLVAQGALERLGYRDVREMIAERFHASPALLERLNPAAAWEAGTDVRVPGVVALELPSAGARSDTPERTAALVTVSDTTKSITALDADGAILLHAPVTVGSEHDPLPIGEWQVVGVYFQPKFHYNPDLFWDADPSHAKTVIAGGPNNPVGLVWLDIDKEHYGLHGTPEPGRVGHTTSHGCVRLTNWDAVRLAALVAKGTKVEFRR